MVKLGGLFGIALLASGLGAWAGDQAYDPATRTAIQRTITQQLDALAHDDAKAAESFAAPAIQSKFPEPAKFLEMVKKGYSALLRPRSTQFGELAISPHGPLQTMTIVAADGTLWTAIYSFEQVEGGWRITGCGLQRIEGQQDI